MVRDRAEPPGDSPTNEEAAFGVVALAASAGGLRALGEVLSRLPPDLPAAILVVQHLDPRYPSHLADILGRQTGLPVKVAEDGEYLRLGCVYVAPPNRHLLVGSDGTVHLTESELVHFVRPSADLMFESVAACYKDRAIAVVLSGTGSDGAMGVRAVKSMGGTVIVQDPESAEFSGMPKGAADTGAADHVLALEAIGPALARLVAGEKSE